MLDAPKRVPPTSAISDPSRVIATWYSHGRRPKARTSYHAITMEHVTGIGGVFFRAKNPETLSAWSEDTFGVSRTPRDYNTAPSIQQAGATVFAPFPSDTDYFGNPSQEWMINFRVANLDRMMAQLRAKGIEATLDPEIYPNGRFARLNDQREIRSSSGSPRPIADGL